MLVTKELFIYVSIKNNERVYAYHLPVTFQENVVAPFLKGNYSKIDRTYVDKYFTEYVKDKDGKIIPSINYMILNKSVALRKKWEIFLESSINENVEL